MEHENRTWRRRKPRGGEMNTKAVEGCAAAWRITFQAFTTPRSDAIAARRGVRRLRTTEALTGAAGKNNLGVSQRLRRQASRASAA